MKKSLRLLSAVAMSAAVMFIGFNASAVELRGSHKANQVACKSCHTKGMKQAGTTEGCLSCHESYDAVRALTEKNHPELEVNPHMDGHLGELDCTDCHHIHKPSEVVCSECHQFGFTAP
ncbi:cytochrome c3 family protein [Shewanella sp. A3A]|nr:cytochrome c3 family protein [Shewanella ferrihydritica]